jgi:hypothetical protein
MFTLQPINCCDIPSSCLQLMARPENNLEWDLGTLSLKALSPNTHITIHGATNLIGDLNHKNKRQAANISDWLMDGPGKYSIYCLFLLIVD